jgi:hypothetical protein
MKDQIAGGGLLHRRSLLKATGAGVAASMLVPVKAAEDWMTHVGAPQSEYVSSSAFA